MSLLTCLGLLMALFGCVYTEKCQVSQSKQNPMMMVPKDCKEGCCKDKDNFSDCCDKGKLISMIVGIVVGVVALVVIIIVVICVCKYKKKKKIEAENQPNNNDVGITMTQQAIYPAVPGSAPPNPYHQGTPTGPPPMYPGTPQQAFGENQDTYPEKH